MNSKVSPINRARVTVVIPCYNDGLFLEEAVASIKAQTCADYRIVVVDDASSDPATRDVLTALAGDDAVQVLYLEKNRGPAHARNEGISASKSEYILVLDATDKFAPTFMEKAVAVLDADPKVGVVTCGVQAFGLEANYWLPKGGGVKNFLVENNCCGNAMYRRRFWEDAGGYDAGVLFEDWDFWISGTSKGWEVHVIKEPLFFYRKLKRSKSTGDGVKKAETYRLMVAKHREVFCANIEDVLYQKEMQLLMQYFTPTYRKYSQLLAVLTKLSYYGRTLLGMKR